VVQCARAATGRLSVSGRARRKENRMSWLTREFKTEKPLVGVVHLLPLPGSPRYGGSLSTVLNAARRSANTLFDAGFDAVILENFGDIPFHTDRVEPHVVAIASLLVREFATRGPCGVNLLRNAAADALAAAFAGGGRFIRVNVHTGAVLADQGIIEGRAAATLRYRQSLGSTVRILADVRVKHAAPLVPRDPVAEARDCVERGLADGLIITGGRTGELGDLAAAARLRRELRGVPVFMGSGVSARTASQALQAADGIIVGTALERTLGVIDARAARAFVKAAR
jgi:hypothetical protein